VRAGRVSPHIRKIEILRDEKSLRSLRAVPDILVDMATQLFDVHRVDVVTKSAEGRDETVGQILVQFDLHRLIGISTKGRSSCAEACSEINTGGSGRVAGRSAVPERRRAGTKHRERRAESYKGENRGNVRRSFRAQSCVILIRLPGARCAPPCIRALWLLAVSVRDRVCAAR
jgi:hypothetical protein